MASAAAVAKEPLRMGYQMKRFALTPWWASCAGAKKSWASDLVAILVSTKRATVMKSAFDSAPAAAVTVGVCQ